MDNTLQVFNYKEHQVRTVEVNGEVWFVAKDVCDILEIQNVTQAVQNLDEDERSMHYIGRQGEANIISEAGLYKLIFNSRKPEAKEFTRWVTHEVLPAIHRTGTFTVNQPQISLEELELRRNALNLERAKLINSMIENPSFPMTPETRTVFAYEVFKLASGHDYLAMLPECTEKWYTATEIGNELGISANKVGRIAKTHGIKAPDGESNEYGRWIFSKSQYSSREVPSFIYNENALDWFKDFMRETV